MGKVTPDQIFMTALAMLLKMRGGEFKYTQMELDFFRHLHGVTGQLGIQIHEDTITVFLIDQPVAQA